MSNHWEVIVVNKNAHVQSTTDAWYDPIDKVNTRVAFEIGDQRDANIICDALNLSGITPVDAARRMGLLDVDHVVETSEKLKKLLRYKVDKNATIGAPIPHSFVDPDILKRD